MTKELQAETVDRENIVQRVEKLKQEGYRFVTITCVEVVHGRAELLYHFDLDLALIHLRCVADAAGPLPSICPLFAAAYLVENEIQDQFGLVFAGLVPDYQRTLYLEDDGTDPPFLRSLREEKES